MTTTDGYNAVLLTQSIQLSACLVARLCVSGGDVHFGSVGNIAFRDHTPNAFGTTGDENDLALYSVSATNSVGFQDTQVAYRNVEKSRTVHLEYMF
jgi:hypothetical protein